MSFHKCKIVGLGVDPETYHSKAGERGDPKFLMSPSALREFSRCPARWRAGYSLPPSKSRAFGNLVDTMLLTPDLMTKRFAVQPETYTDSKGALKPWAYQSTTCRQWGVDQRAAGKEIVTKDQIEDASALIHRFTADPIIAAWHEACDKQVHIQGVWKDPDTGVSFPVRCLLDYVPRADTEFHNCIGDLKTSHSGELRKFTRDCFAFGYHIQAAVGLQLHNAATDEGRAKWCIVGAENFEPWQPFKRFFHETFLELGQLHLLSALRVYAECLKTDVWPGYDDNDDAIQGWGLLVAEPWMAPQTTSLKATATEVQTKPEDVDFT